MHHVQLSGFFLQDLSEVALPGLAEEDSDQTDFRPRSSSAGIKSLIKFRHRNKSGDNNSNNNTPHGTPPDSSGKGLRGFLDSLSFSRPRSKSDAANLKATAMLRKKHASGGHPLTHQASLGSSSSHGGSADFDPMQRPRSTSVGAKDRLRMQRLEKEMRISGSKLPAAMDNMTLMSHIINNGVKSQNGANHRVSAVLSYTSESKHPMHQTSEA